ncbi:hypothetical protein [Halomonas sp. CKK8]|nr:hypothetical protein [Halomonas sp. CKK8]WFM71236.1 hypothetical protein P8934_17900 [Halomonas sp. CKK8]
MEDALFARLAGFQRLYRQIADHHTGLRLGHGEQADFCPLCDARPAAAS